MLLKRKGEPARVALRVELGPETLLGTQGRGQASLQHP